MKIGFLLFEDFIQKKDLGSSRIRGHWVIKELQKQGIDAERFVQGKDYDVVVYQKAYWKEHAKAFKGLKILDICDPDWLDGFEIVNFIQNVDVITTSSEALSEEIKKFTYKPVVCIQDCVDFSTLPERKKHSGEAKKVCWFGYSHNLEVLDPTFSKIKKLGLTLRVISDGKLNCGECEIENIKWDKDTVDKYIQECDFCLLPEIKKGRFKYKSQNKTHHSLALGLPVAKTPQEMERFMDPIEREKEVKDRICEVKNIDYHAITLLQIINQHLNEKA